MDFLISLRVCLQDKPDGQGVLSGGCPVIEKQIYELNYGVAVEFLEEMYCLIGTTVSD